MIVHPITPGFGVEIEGIDLSNLDDSALREIYDLWLKYGVLWFRGQNLTDDQLQAFSANFGPLDKIPYFDKLDVKGKDINPYILPISNIEKKGKPIGGLGTGEAVWHADMTYMEEPGIGMILYGVILPSTGGDTQFSDQYAAYDGLPDALKSRIKNLLLKHDASHTSDGEIRRGFETQVSDSPIDVPGAVHPIVYTHPETGRKALSLGRRDWAYVVGLPLEDSESLLDELWAEATKDDYVITHQWQLGDVIAWDNRCTLHRRDGFNEPRLLKRCQVMQKQAA